MIRTTLLAALLLSYISSISQPKTDTDSLKQVLRNSALSSGDRSKTYKLLGKQSLDIDPRITIAYIDSALTIELNSKEVSKQLPQLYMIKGLAFRRQSIFDDALKNHNEALRYSQELGDRSTEAIVYMELATIAEMSGELVKAIELNQKALDTQIELKDTANIVTVYNNIGIIYMGKDDFEGAIRYYKKAIDLNNKSHNSGANARIINNIGLVFQKQNKLDSALDYFNAALSTLDINKQKYGYALINNNIGIVHRNLAQYDRALENFSIAKKLQTELNDLYGLGLVNYNIAQVHFRKGDYKKSLKSLDEATAFAKQANSLSLLTDIADYSAKTYEKLGDFRNAFLLQKQEKIYSDSMQRKSLSKEMANLEVKYQVKQQQAQIELLKSQNDLHLATAENKDLILITSIGFSVLILTLLVLAYRSLRIKQKTNAIIKEKNEKLEHLNHEKNSLMAIVAHDLISPLNSIGGIANILPNLGPLNAPQREFVNVINDVVDSSRALVKDVMDLSALENNELKLHFEPVAIDTLIAECKTKYAPESIRKEIKLEIVANGPLEPVNTDKQHIDRILQNLVSNALKFSQAGTTVRMGASRENGTLTFFVSDEGPGISSEDQKLLFRKFMKLSARPTSGESSTGLGLSIVKGLIEELGGDIIVKSAPGKGTTFECTIPVDH
jgi:signal transduction histidine kinase/Tfp pilus assembly protein PilF